MALDDFVDDDDFNGEGQDIEVGDVPAITVNSPPGHFRQWRNYEPYQYFDDDEDEEDIIMEIGDCDIDGSDSDRMIVCGPANCSKKEIIKSDVYVGLEDAQRS